MKIDRREFLKVGAFGMGAAAIAQTVPDPDKYQVFIPAVSSGCNQDYQKLIEYPVPQGHISPGFTFVDIPECRKYILEISARMIKTVAWQMSLRINADGEPNYEQFTHYDFVYYDPQSQDKPEVYPTIAKLDQFDFPRTQLIGELNYPYYAKIEIDNTPGLFKNLSASGMFPVGATSVQTLVKFQMNGLYKSTDLIGRMNLYCNHPTGSFNSNTIVRLYGVR